MANTKCFQKLHAHVILTDFMQICYGKYQMFPKTTCTRNTQNFTNKKTECVENESTIVMFNSFQRNIICNAMNESILQVS